jgi:hypothetical protein
MAWKQKRQFECVASTGTSLIDTSDLWGKRIRVTVEEEVSECCEKWRGAAVSYHHVHGELMGGGGGYVATYCPECGKRL